MDPVSFITLEDGDDLIVSFAIVEEDAGEVVSLTLLRTPKYEHILPPDERGVNVSHENDAETDDDMLAAVDWSGDEVVLLTTHGRRYHLDVHRVDEEEIREAKRFLAKMNADERFSLMISNEPIDGE